MDNAEIAVIVGKVARARGALEALNDDPLDQYPGLAGMFDSEIDDLEDVVERLLDEVDDRDE